MAIIASIDKMLTSQEVATLFRVDPNTVVRWGKEGHLEAIRTPGGKLFRFPENAVRKALQAGVVAPAAEAVA